MNSSNLHQIFSHYIERFEEINAKGSEEYYKWSIAAKFRPMMDEALTSDADVFPVKIKAVRDSTENLIDSYTQPFSGLCSFAAEEPETVRQMFIDLFADDQGDLAVRTEKILRFLKQSHELKEKYAPTSFMYNDDFHSVTAYLFLYDSDHNYLYKATHAHEFADCVEFYDDWGYGENVKLNVYYRFCDELVAAMKADEDLMRTDASRYSLYEAKYGPFHPDPEKHILAFDLIFCCSTYGLFDGITYSKLNAAEKKQYREKVDKAKKAEEALAAALEEEKQLKEALEYVGKAFVPKAIVMHKKFGPGVISSVEDGRAIVDFSELGSKKLKLIDSVAAGLISLEDDQLKQYLPVLKKASLIHTSLKQAEEEYNKYCL